MATNLAFLSTKSVDEVDDRGRRITGDTLLFLFNSHNEPIPFQLPTHTPGEAWEAVIDTASDPDQKQFRTEDQYPLQARSLAVLKLVKSRRPIWK